MSVRQALAHPWLSILKQPGIEMSEQYQISTERLVREDIGHQKCYGGIKKGKGCHMVTQSIGLVSDALLLNLFQGQTHFGHRLL